MNDRLVKKLLHFTDNVLAIDNHVTLARQIRSVIEKQLKTRENCESPNFEISSMPVCHMQFHLTQH